MVGGVDVGPPSVSAEPAAAPATAPSARQEAPVAPEAAPRAAAPPYDAEAEARARQAQERAAFEAEWPLLGISYHFLAQVRARPDGSSPVVGYLRRGSTFRAKPGLRGPGCRRG